MTTPPRVELYIRLIFPLAHIEPGTRLVVRLFCSERPADCSPILVLRLRIACCILGGTALTMRVRPREFAALAR